MSEPRRATWLVLLGTCWLSISACAFGQEQPPLTLKQAVALAVENSSELALARSRYAVAERQEAQANAPFRPNLYAGSGAAYTSGFPMTPVGSAPALFNLSYVQTVFNPPLRGQAQAAAQRVEIQRLSVEGGRDAVILRTAAVFLDLAQVRHALEVWRGTRDTVRGLQDVARNRVAEGRDLPIEIVRADLTRARAAQRIVQLEGREEALVSELRALTGFRSDLPLEIVPETIGPGPEQATTELVALALASSPELQQAEYERRGRIDRLHGERGGYWPTLDVVGEYALLSKFNNYDEFFRQFERHNVTVGIQARWSLFSAQTTSAVALAQSELQQVEAELRRKREEIELAVHRQAQSVRELRAVREVAELELKLAQEDLRMVQERFDAERANLRDLESARLGECDKWSAFLQADYDSQQAQLELLNTTGQLRRVFP
jgi:outer membrane protein TolC